MVATAVCAVAERAEAIQKTDKPVATPWWGLPAASTGVLGRVAWMREWFIQLKVPATDPAAAPTRAETLNLELPDLPSNNTNAQHNLEEREVSFTSDRDSVILSPASSPGAYPSFRSPRSLTTPASSLSLESKQTDYRCQDGNELADQQRALQQEREGDVRSTDPCSEQSSSFFENAMANAEGVFGWTSHVPAQPAMACTSLRRDFQDDAINSTDGA